jgi:LCP family protein required for cell wall assembly
VELLDFIWPGLGHAYARRPRLAVLFAVPPALIVLVAAYLLLTDPAAFALNLLGPVFAGVVLVLIVVHGVWRVAAILDAWRITRPAPRPSRRRSVAFAAVLTAVVLVVHLTAAAYVQSFTAAGARIFTSDRPQGPDPVDNALGGDPIPSRAPGQTGIPGDINGDGVVDGHDIVPGDTNGDGIVDGNDDPQTDPEDGDGTDPGGSPAPGPSFDPSASPPPFDSNDVPTGALPTAGPINVLFIGLDSSFDRNHSLSDTLMVASYYPERDTLTMISFPRDTSFIPLYKGGSYPNRINTFLNYARGNTALFPEGPIAALMNELGYLLGSPIEFYAATNLDGLPVAVDAVGGVDIVLDKPIADGSMDLYMDAGAYHLDGTQALAVARSRHGSSDFARARRQQQIILALAARVKDPAVLLNLPQIIDALAAVVRTNLPRDQVPLLLSLLQDANNAATEHIVLSPPAGYAQVIPAIEVAGRYMTELNIVAIRELSVRIFGPYSRYH